MSTERSAKGGNWELRRNDPFFSHVTGLNATRRESSPLHSSLSSARGCLQKTSMKVFTRFTRFFRVIFYPQFRQLPPAQSPLTTATPRICPQNKIPSTKYPHILYTFYPPNATPAPVLRWSAAATTTWPSPRTCTASPSSGPMPL